MPSYFYHLKFELYPYPSTDDSPNSSPSKQKRTKEEEEERRRTFWLPEQGTDIFDTSGGGGRWPRHKAVKNGGGARDRRGIGSWEESRAAGAGAGAGVGAGAVIDCGLARASRTLGEDGEEGVAVQIPNEGHLEFAPPSAANVVRDQGVAARDWRFGRVRVESLDMREVADSRPGMEMASSAQSSSDGTARAGNGINAGLAPEAAGVGRVTKARYEVVEGKNTEVGWGIVHLYRDGEETAGLGNTEVVYTARSEGADQQNKPTASGGLGVREEKEGEDCTTLCIPAVPSYLTPSDFLGFVGEKTREEVSHFRMVMTGRMNRYLVLMKFRDGGAARRWRKEWDGKVFNSMEVSIHISTSHEF